MYLITDVHLFYNYNFMRRVKASCVPVVLFLVYFVY